MYTTILTLHKQGISQRKIARTTNTHRKTVRKIILKENLQGEKLLILVIILVWHVV